MMTIVAIAVLALLASFTCSLFEAALYAVTPSEVEVLRERKVFGAERMARLRKNVEEPIAAILTINTVANTLGSALCGALVGQHYGDAAVGLFAAIFTFSVLIVSEIIPKSLGVQYADVLAPRIAWPLQVMIWVSWPVARGARALMHQFTRNDTQSGPGIDEIVMLSRLARKGGVLRARELRWVENALRLDTVSAHDLMTPRTVVDALPADMAISELRDAKLHWVHTRLPLIEGSDPDAIVGLIHSKDVFRALLDKTYDVRLRDLAHPIDFVPETMPGHRLLDKFITEKKHLVAVADEYGGFEGIVTLEDVLECLLGSEIVDEHDRHADLRLVARRLARQRAERHDLEMKQGDG